MADKLTSVEKLPTTVVVELPYYDWMIALMAMNEVSGRLRGLDECAMIDPAWERTAADLKGVIRNIVCTIRKAEMAISEERANTQAANSLKRVFEEESLEYKS
jgi:hypothetical protein